MGSFSKTRATDAFAEELRSLLTDPDRMQRLGAAANERVRKQFLGIRHLLQYVGIIERLLATT